jgi:myo-inositol 2-dehydrogenase/D-chiro-inositol 1-dehydrogenase
MLKIGVIGAGFIGSVHAKNVARHPGTQLVAVSDVNLEAAKKLAATTGAKAVGDPAEIFSDKEEAVLFVP